MTSLFSNHSFHKSKFALKCDCRPKNGRETHRNKRKGQIRLVGRCGSFRVLVTTGLSQSYQLSHVSQRCSSEKVNFHISISQTTDFHFANYRFPFRKLQISLSFRSISQTTDFPFISFHFVSFHFVSQTTVSPSLGGKAN